VTKERQKEQVTAGISSPVASKLTKHVHCPDKKEDRN